MDWLHIVLRVIHIGAGIFWVGSAAFLVFFLQPTITELGAQGGAVMGHLAEKRKLPAITGISAVLTIAAGIWLYWRDTDGFDLDIITTAPGIGFTVGSIAAIIAFVIGLGVIRPAVERMASLAGGVGGGAPSPEAAQQLAAIQRRMRGLGLFNMGLLVVAVVAMASARYL